MQNTVTLETVALNATPDMTDLTSAAPTFQSAKARTAAPWLRTLALKWDMIAVITLMLTSAAYGLYALLFLTGY